MNEVDNEERLVNSIVLFLITIFCLGVSWWSMARGYESFVGGFIPAAAISTIFVLMLFGLNYTLRRGLMRGISKLKITAILLVYLFVVALSFSGMFNKFYSTFMRTTLIQEEMEKKTVDLLELQSKAKSELTTVEMDSIKGQVEALLLELKEQIKNPSEPGMGVKARNKLQEIQVVLGRKEAFDIDQPVSKQTKHLEELGERYALKINAAMNASDKIKANNAPEKRTYEEKLGKDIKDIVSDLSQKRTALSEEKNNEIAHANALASLQSAVEKYRKYAQEISTLTKGGSFDFTDKAQKIKVINDRVGEIPHTYESAKLHLDRGIVWVAAFLALAIDLIVPIFVYVLTPRGAQRRSNGRIGNKGPKPLEDH